MNLADLLKQPEGKTLEFKRKLSFAAGVLRTVFPFANTADGTVMTGVEDGARNVRGVADPLTLEERLASLLSDGIAPHLLPDIKILPWRSSNVLAVHIYPSPVGRHYLKAAGIATGVCVRVGSTNRLADDDMVAELRRSGLGKSFDEQAIPELDPEAISDRLAGRFRILRQRAKVAAQ